MCCVCHQVVLFNYCRCCRPASHTQKKKNLHLLASLVVIMMGSLHMVLERVFLFGLNVSIHAKVKILMPQTFHDVVQKALIAEEELISGVQSRTLARLAWQVSSGAQQHQTPTRRSPGYRGF
jgi:hypothetical protein